MNTVYKPPLIKHAQAGFTLLELLVVTLIVSLLFSISVPVYSDYIRRAQLSEAMLLAQDIRHQITDYYSRTGRLPADNKALGLVADNRLLGNYVSRIQVKTGQIRVFFRDPKLHNQILVFKPIAETLDPQYPQLTLRWQCYGDGLDEVYLPQTCR